MISKITCYRYDQIIALIRKEKALSRVAISKYTGHSKPTVSNVINHLIEKNVVTEVGTGEANSNGGRKPIILSFNKDYRNIISIDMGGTKTIAALLNLDGEIIKTHTFSSKAFKTKEDIVNVLTVKISEFVEHSGTVPILGISIGVPGIVDKKRGVVSYMPSFNMTDLDLEMPLKRVFNLPVFLENDVTLSAYGEIWIGSGSQYNTILLVSIGTGIGGGIVIDKRVHTGSGGRAGEICEMVTDWTKEKKSKKQFGRLENWIAGYALEEFISKKNLGDDLSLFSKGKIVNAEFDDFLTQGAKHLALALGNAVVLLDPEKVILAGGVGYNFYEKMYPTINKTLKEVLPSSFYSENLVEKSLLEPYGCVMGGCKAVQKENLIDSIFKS
jgi:predicted NBD/HSP70 family sugar kinase